MSGSRPFRVAAPTVAAPSFPRSYGRKAAFALLSAGGVVAIAVFLAAARPSAGSLPRASDQPVSSPITGVPAPTSSPSPQSTVPSPGPAPSRQLIDSMRVMGPSPAPAAAPTPSARTVLITFSHGTDGWSTFWGNITEAPVTSPAVDGASLLLTTSSSRYSAVGTTTGVAQLKPGDTVTYHVWSSGRSGRIRPFIQNDRFNIEFAGTGDTQLPSTRGWFTLTWTVPATSSVKGIGLQVINPDPYHHRLRLAIGGLSWPQN